MHTLETMLDQMPNMAKPQRKFMLILLNALMYLPSKFNFRNLGRYTDLNEKTFSRWFLRPFDFLALNLLILKDVLQGGGECVAAIDASFVPKSGRKSYGLDWFWSGSQGRAERGQEISLLALVDVTRHTAYNLSVYQTPDLPKSTAKQDKQDKQAKKAKQVAITPPKNQAQGLSPNPSSARCPPHE